MKYVILVCLGKEFTRTKKKYLMSELLFKFIVTEDLDVTLYIDLRLIIVIECRMVIKRIAFYPYYYNYRYTNGYSLLSNVIVRHWYTKP